MDGVGRLEVCVQLRNFIIADRRDQLFDEMCQLVLDTVRLFEGVEGNVWRWNVWILSDFVKNLKFGTRPATVSPTDDTFLNW